uniref:Putative secreted protein n=1 Tax=Ixodes ricinus TaxID=34613 RepID=A0A6B0UHZ8_IXORI
MKADVMVLAAMSCIGVASSQQVSRSTIVGIDSLRRVVDAQQGRYEDLQNSWHEAKVSQVVMVCQCIFTYYHCKHAPSCRTWRRLQLDTSVTHGQILGTMLNAACI